MTTTTKKSINKYIILAFLGGFVGAHRFYIGKTRSATVMLVITLLACLFSSWTIFYVVLIWAIIDVFIALCNISNPQKVLQQTKEERKKDEKYNEYMLNLFVKILEELPDFLKSIPGAILSFLIEVGIVVYLVVTFGFSLFLNCPSGDTGCSCLVSSVNKNMSFSDKVTFIINGANRQDLLPYLDFGDALKCAIVAD